MDAQLYFGLMYVCGRGTLQSYTDAYLCFRRATEQGHRDVGRHASGKVDALYAVGPLMRHAVEEFGSKGRHFVDQAELIEALRAEQAGSTLLIKGSRSAAMDKVVAALCGVSGENH